MKWANSLAVYCKRQPGPSVPTLLHVYFKDTIIKNPDPNLNPFFYNTEKYISFSFPLNTPDICAVNLA